MRLCVLAGIFAALLVSIIGLNSCEARKWIFQDVYADQVVLPNYYTTIEDVTGAKENGNNVAIRNVVNGKLKNDNVHADAAILQSKIDSTTGWIKNNTGRFNQAEPFWFLRSQYGWKMMLNDSLIFDREFVIVSDSTDTIAIFGNDSVHIQPKAHFDGVVYADDSLLTTKGIRAVKNIRGDSLISDKGARITNTVIADSININTGCRADRGIFDSIRIGGGEWVTTMATGGFVMKIMNPTDTTKVCWTDSAHYYVFNDNVSLNFNASDSLRFDAVTEILDGDTTFLVSGFPSFLKVTSNKSFYLPFVVSGAIKTTTGSGYESPHVINASMKLTTTPIDTISINIIFVDSEIFDYYQFIVAECNLSYTR
jgi:hypothetical protein